MVTVPTPNFPTSLDSQSSASPLAMAAIGSLLKTKLTASPGVSGTTLDVVSTTGFPSKGLLAVGTSNDNTEHVTYTGITATSFTGVTRAFGDTTARAHIVDAVVSQVIFPETVNLHGAQIVALETYMGATLISSTTLSGAAATVDLTGITGQFSGLLIQAMTRTAQAATEDALLMRVGNGSFDAGANYDYVQSVANGSTMTVSNGAAGSFFVVGPTPGNNAPASVFGEAHVFIWDYASASAKKVFIADAVSIKGTSSGDFSMTKNGGGWRSTSAIDRVRLLSSSGANLVAGTIVRLYGMK